MNSEKKSEPLNVEQARAGIDLHLEALQSCSDAAFRASGNVEYLRLQNRLVNFELFYRLMNHEVKSCQTKAFSMIAS